MHSKNFFINRNIQRIYFRKLRKLLTLEEKYLYSIKISRMIFDSKVLSFCKNIAVFLSFDGEIETSVLISKLWQKKYNVFVPVIHSFRKKILLFSEYLYSTNLVLNKFNILEPIVFDKNSCFSCYEMDIIICPLVAFDKFGYRLGMGGGFYDKILYNWKNKNFFPIGLAYDFQLINRLSPAPWETPLPVIFTPSKLWKQYN
ncbi:MAG: 5-formyltetrahydrofolate cyclo-ligase [Buchnera aphidicola (Nurudea yanoniella)]